MSKAKQNGKLSAFVKGLASSLDLRIQPEITSYPHKSTTSALRKDMSRIGADMRKVIDYEYEKYRKKEKSS